MSGSNSEIVPNIVFNEIPSPLYRPDSYVEVRPTFGNVGILPFPARNLIVGQLLSSGIGAAGVLYQNITQPQAGTALFGAGSLADRMIRKYLATGCTIPLDVIALADAGGAAKAAYAVTFGGPATGNGTTAIGFAGMRYAVGTLTGDPGSVVASELMAAINADPQAPVVATVGSGGTANVLTLTAKNGGTEGNYLSVIPNPAVGDVFPPGVSITSLTEPVSGATNPSISAVITAITGLWYTGIATAWQDTPNLQALATELARRFTATVREDGRAYVCLNGTYSQQLAQIPNINSQFIVALPMTAPGSLPSDVAASMLGVCEQSLVQDPSLQLRDMVLPGIVGPQRANLLNDLEQELMLAGKGSTFNVLRDGRVTLQRVVSTYTSNTAGIPDSTTYFDIMETAVASRIRYDWRQFFKLNFPKNKLAPDGSLAEAYNPNVCTPRRAKGAWASRMLTYAKQGWIENETADAASAVFKIDPNDRNRLDYQVQYTRIGNLIVDAGVLMFEVL